MSFFVFLVFVFCGVALAAGFMASLVHAPAMSRFVRKSYAGRPRLLGGS